MAEADPGGWRTTAHGALVQLSDPHFGTERPDLVEALVAWARSRTLAAVVLSGDVTQRATRGQFAAARRFVDRLGAQPVFVMPGNHDLPLYALHERLLAPHRRYAAAFGPPEDLSVALPGWHLVLLNTTRRLRHTRGGVDEAQRERSAGWLRESAPGAVRVVVTHQPAQVWLPKDLENRLIGADEALRAWHAAGADLVLGGHIHLPQAMDLRPAVASDVERARPMWGVQAGTALSHRVRGGVPNGFNELVIGCGPRPAGSTHSPAVAPMACGWREWRWNGLDFAPEPLRWLPLAARECRSP